MKKFWYFLLCLTIFFSPLKRQNFCMALSQSTTYAKVSSNCVLYKNQDMNESLDNIYFVIPETYFVSVINFVSDSCMKVQYGNFTGYVKSSDIVIASFIPQTKQLEGVTFDIKDTSGTQIWSIPATSGRVLTTISAGVKNISYIAFAYGEIPTGGESNLWYYVTYTPEASSTSVFEGYVYSENVTNLSEIPVNIEVNPESENIDESIEDTILISSSVRTVLIALISIPVIIFLAVILYKIVKKYRENTFNKRNLIQKESENFAENNTFSAPNEHAGVLKKQLMNLKNSSFVRKNRHTYSGDDYPVFPSYDSDDDLL